MQTVDCQGLACPQPVLRTKHFIVSNPGLSEFTVFVDNAASAENVVRFCESQGFSASLQQDGNDFESVKSEESGSESTEAVESRLWQDFGTRLTLNGFER